MQPGNDPSAVVFGWLSDGTPEWDLLELNSSYYMIYGFQSCERLVHDAGRIPETGYLTLLASSLFTFSYFEGLSHNIQHFGG